MRNNLPVTQREYEIPDGATLMSTTDVQSHIQYANAAFIHASGFSREEIEGQPHNMIRHPDMPAQAFADMWATLGRGEPWTGLVKNRRKNGDHYWVRANAMPVIRHGKRVGYMSVRTKPTREEVNAAETLYSAINAGKAAVRLHKGVVLRTGPFGFTSLLQTMPVRWRIRSALLGAWGVLIGSMATMGLGVAAIGSGALVALCTLALTSWVLEMQISKPLEHLRNEALAVASGESHASKLSNRVDEIGITLRSVGQLGLMFRWLIDDVSEQVLNVKTATTEIAQGNNDLSSRTEQAAASVQQTASSMEQMTATVKGSAETALQANQLSGSASEAASRGGMAVAQVVNTMTEINQSSQRIADIISVIDGIAFQTNILALNAAVEAARAGEQGRGFAVVAGEVRNLAQRSADAAREIKALIGSSVDKVEAGTKLVDDAGRTMEDIVTQVRRVSDLIAELSSASHEQQGGISQIGQAIGNLDAITQQNAALVEQSAAASDSLKQQAERLVEAVSVFR